jgi:hypothetical protein
MEMPRAERLYVVVDGAEEPSVFREADEYNVSVYADGMVRGTRRGWPVRRQ